MFSWPLNASNGTFGDKAISKVADYFLNLFIGAECDAYSILPEWIIIKTYMFPIICNN